jgi:hypothetical protein
MVMGRESPLNISVGNMIFRNQFVPEQAGKSALMQPNAASILAAAHRRWLDL